MRRLTNITATLVIAVAATPGVAIAQNFSSPDARDSARQVTGTGGLGIMNGRDLVSPDARDSARRAAAPETNLQSPDARDASNPGVSTYQPGRASLPAQRIVVPASNGFDWGDAGIGAAGMLGLVALAAGTLMVATHRRRERRVPITTG
jgi:hypothetical protein